MAQMVPAEEAFVITVGVPHEGTQAHCNRVITVLKQAGYHAGQTSNESLLALAEQASLTQAMEEIEST